MFINIMLAFYYKKVERLHYLRSIDEESKVHTLSSRWLNVNRTGFETCGERLTLDDIMTEGEAT